MATGLREESVPSRLVGVTDREEGIGGRMCFRLTFLESCFL